MKKQIIEEISRLQEIMGVKKEIISEERLIGRASRWLSDIMNGSSNEVSKVVTRIGNRNASEFRLPSGSIVRLLSNEVDDILRAISNGTGLRNLTDNAKDAVKKILDEFGYLEPKKLWDDYVDEIIQGGNADEEKFFRNLQRRLEEIDPVTRSKKSLKDVLKEYFPNDLDFVDEIFPYVDSKLDDYSNGLLKNRGGKLVKEISPDIVDFIDNIIPLTREEIQKLSKSTWLTKLQDVFRKGPETVEEIKRLMKTLEKGNLSVQERGLVEKAILEKMNTIYNWKAQSEKYMEGFIKELSGSKDRGLIELKEKLESIKPSQGWNVARQVMSETSWMKKRWEAFAEAFQNTMSLEKAIYKYMGPKKFWNWITKNVRKLWSETLDDAAENAKPIKTGSIWNAIKTGSRRGFPKFSQVVDDAGNIKPDYYETLRKIGKNPLAWESYGWEWFMRTIKWKTYYAFLETVIPAIFLKLGITPKDHECALALADVMKARDITNSDSVFELITDNQLKVLPPCIQELVNKDEKYRLTNIILLADYMVSPGSVKGNYFFPQMWESFTEFSGLGNITTFIPGYLDDILLDFPYKIYKGIRLYDTTGANIENENQQDSNNNPPPQAPTHEEKKESFELWCQGNGKTFASWDDVNKIGKTQDGIQYKLKADKSTFEPLAIDNTIDTVEELLTTYPFLRTNNSEITLNADKTFNEKISDGRNLTIKMIDGQAYYVKSDGVDYTPPVKVESTN
jgi:hypothetical protein